jgi:hypothetical protein
MALISPIRGILRVPSHCLSMVLVNITHHAEGYIFLAHIIKEQDTTYLEYAGRVKPLTPIHILVSHHLCHQGGFKDMERYAFSPIISLDFCGSHAFKLLSCDCDAGIALCLYNNDCGFIQVLDLYGHHIVHLLLDNLLTLDTCSLFIVA